MSNDLSIIETAHALADRGIYVFPVDAAKKPLVKWGAEACIDHDQIEAWWNKYAHAHLGIDTGKSGLFVLDVDIKNGKPGLESLVDLQNTYGPLPATIMAKTRSGGQHHYFRGEARNSVERIRPGLDVRSLGGYVVAPPSTGYRWEALSLLDTEPAVAPEWLIEEAKGEPRPEHGQIENGEPIPEGSRNDTLFRMACDWRGQGMDPEAILRDLVSINAHRCQPPLDQRDLVRIAISAGRFPAGDRKPADRPNGVKMKSMRSIISGPVREREFIIKDFIPKGWSGSIFGPGGIGKSHLLNEQATCVALGIPFYGHEVPRLCRVGLISPEMDAIEFQRRFKALHEHRYSQMMAWEDFEAALDNIFALTMEDFKGIGKRDIIKHFDFFESHVRGNDLDLLIIDTLSQVHNADENKNNEMGQVMQEVKRLSDVTGCTIELSHHVSKAARANGSHSTARGASTIRDSLQWSFALEPHPQDKDGEGKILRLRHDKGNFTAKVGDIWLRKGEGGILHPISQAEADDLVRAPSEERDLGDQIKAMEHFRRLWEQGVKPPVSILEKASIGLGRTRAAAVIAKLRAERKIIVVPSSEYYSDNSRGNIVLPASPENLAAWSHHVPGAAPEEED